MALGFASGELNSEPANMLLCGARPGVLPYHNAHVVSPRRPTSRQHSNAVNSRRRGATVVKAQLQETDALSRRSAGLMVATALTLVEAVPVWGMTLPAMAAGEHSFYDFTVTRGGEPFALNQNYPSLRYLYEKYHLEDGTGFNLVAFPANQFGCQAPGSSDVEREYAIRKFGFEFPVMDKIAVKYKGTPQCQKSTSLAGIDDEEALANTPQPVDPTPVQAMDPTYAFLKTKPFNREIEWNYTKFLVGRDGQVLGRYKPADPLEQGMEADVVAALAGKPLPNKRAFVYGGPGK